MANTYIDHGYLNFENGSYTDVLNTDNFITEKSVPFIEFSTDAGVNARLMATIILSNLKAGSIILKMEKEIEVSTGIWVTTPVTDVTSNRSKFANLSTLEEVEKEQATEDLNEDGVLTLVEGYGNEFDGVFVSMFFKGPGVISDYVFGALANQIGITLA